MRTSWLRMVNQPSVRRCRLNAFTTACAATFSWTTPRVPIYRLLLIIGLYRFRRQDPPPDQRDRKTPARHGSELPVQKQHQDDAGDQLQERQCRAVGEGLDELSKAEEVDRKRERISPRSVRAKYDAGSLWTRSNRLARTSAMMRAASRASQRSYQVAMIEVTMPATASTPRNCATPGNLPRPARRRSGFQAQRHDDVEQRLDQMPKPMNIRSFL